MHKDRTETVTTMSRSPQVAEQKYCQTLLQLQIRGGMEDTSKIIFLFLDENICCDPSLELS